MQYALEALDEHNIHEIDAVVMSYYGKVGAHDELPPYDCDWNFYATLDKVGKLLLLTARNEDNVMCGFAMYCIYNHPHHKTILCADCDMIAVDAQHRSKGIGSHLLLMSIELLRKMEVKLVTNRFRVGYDTAPLFAKYGAVVEHAYLMHLE